MNLRTTRISLTLALLLATLLTNNIVERIRFDIEIYGMESRLDEYARFSSFTWLLALLTVIAFIMSLEGIFARFARKEQEEDTQWLEEQLEADKLKNRFDPAFDDTW